MVTHRFSKPARWRHLLASSLLLLPGCELPMPTDASGNPCCPRCLNGVSPLPPHLDQSKDYPLSAGESLVTEFEVGVPSGGCGQPLPRFFPLVEASYASTGVIDIELLSCPCTILAVRQDQGWTRLFLAGRSTGVYRFRIHGRASGRGDLFVTGFSGTGPPEVAIASPWASANVSVRVTE